MIIGAHNAWSYLKPKKWWMRLTYFTARCQRCNIQEQYNKHNVRCFDLRIRFDEHNTPVICHGYTEYRYTYKELLEDLRWLHDKKDVIIRLLLELRSVPEKDWATQKTAFNAFFCKLKTSFPDFKYIDGRSLPDWDKVLSDIEDGREIEDYASVSTPKYIDDWLPILYAWWHNRIVRKREEANKDIILLDFVDIY